MGASAFTGVGLFLAADKLSEKGAVYVGTFTGAAAGAGIATIPKDTGGIRAPLKPAKVAQTTVAGAAAGAFTGFALSKLASGSKYTVVRNVARIMMRVQIVATPRELGITGRWR